MAGAYRSAKAWIAETFEPLRPLYDGWMKTIAGFSWLLVRVVLVIAFFTAFVLYGVVLRLIGKDPMNRTLAEDRDTYWMDNVVNNTGIEEFRRQY